VWEGGVVRGQYPSNIYFLVAANNLRKGCQFMLLGGEYVFFGFRILISMNRSVGIFCVPLKLE
jgi:hypothetical protein